MYSLWKAICLPHISELNTATIEHLMPVSVNNSCNNTVSNDFYRSFHRSDDCHGIVAGVITLRHGL